MRLSGPGEAAELLAERVRGASSGLPAPTLVLGVLGLGDDNDALGEPLAAALGLPHGAYLVGELALPWRPELPFGALTDDNHHYLDADVVADHSLGAREQGQLARALLPSLRARRPARPPLADAHVLLALPSLSTGYRALAAAAAARTAGAATLLIVTPSAARDALARVAAAGHPVVALAVSDGPVFHGGAIYGP